MAAGTDAKDLIKEGIGAIISGQVALKAYELSIQPGVETYLSSLDVTDRDPYDKFLSRILQKMEIRRF